MLNQSKDALKRWQGFDQAIDRWLKERHQLIILLTDFAAHPNFENSQVKTIGKLRAFNTLLIDYISAGHFEFYQRLIEEGEEYNDTKSLYYSKKVLASIDSSTGIALEFTEKYENPDFHGLSQLQEDLSTLAESLESRFAGEDKLIGLLHRAHLNQKS